MRLEGAQLHEFAAVRLREPVGGYHRGGSLTWWKHTGPGSEAPQGALGWDNLTEERFLAEVAILQISRNRRGNRALPQPCEAVARAMVR